YDGEVEGDQDHAPKVPRPRKSAAKKKSKKAKKAVADEEQDVLDPIAEQDVTELLARADAALYKAKGAGKDCLALWEDTKGD
ncbi:MAG: hypothetical protein RIF41_34745, partial [Polyangiaceae bacterium]